MTWKDGEFEPKQQRATDRKRQILKAAIQEFSEVGYHGTTAKKIAARASVATGSFYRYFKDKKAVFIAACLQMDAEIGGTIFAYGRKCRAKGHSEQDVIKMLVEFSAMAHHDNKEFHKEALAMDMTDPDVHKLIADREQHIIRAMVIFFEERKEAYRVDDFEAAADVVCSTVEAACHRIVVFDSELGERRALAQVVDMLCRYLLK